MKKLLLAFLLLILLAGVSYLKVMRDQSSDTKAFENGKKATEDASLEVRAEADSLADLLNKTKSELSDSLAARDELAGSVQDSLLTEISERDKTINSLESDKEKLAAQARKAQQATARKSNTNQHHEILAHYKKMVEKLPSDLSDYERKVALNEISQETAKKFSITQTQLERLKRDNGLN